MRERQHPARPGAHGSRFARAARSVLAAGLITAVAAIATLAGSAAGAGHAARATATPRDRSAPAILRRAKVRLRLSGPARVRLHVTVTLTGTGARRIGSPALAATVKAGKPETVTLSDAGRATLTVPLTRAARAWLRAAIAGCGGIHVAIHLAARSFSVVRHSALAIPSCARTNALLAHLIKTPGGGYRLAAHGTPLGRPAQFRVGAAIADFSPPAAGKAPGDKSDCDPTGAFSGPRPFAFIEPYTDSQHVGHYVGPPDALGTVTGGSVPSGAPDTGDPYLDCNGNGRWDGNLLGGGASTPRFYTKVADPVTARALVVANGKQTIAVEVVDQEGLFNVYQQQIRARVAADGVRLTNIFISATHDESAPDSLGLGGVTSTTSGVNDYWLEYFVARSAQAIEDAYHAMRPATIRYTEALEPSNVRQCWSSYPFVDDQHIPIMQALDSHGKAIVTLASVSQHDETLGFNSGTPQLNAEQDWVSSDWINFFRNSVQKRLGGVAIEMAGSVGSNESPEVYGGAISRTPQKEIAASHPAGCRTEFEAPGGVDDVAGAKHVPLGYTGETEAFGDDIAKSVLAALASRATYTSTSNTIWGARANVCIPLDNLLFEAAATLGVFAHRPGYNTGCSVEYPVSPTGTTSGNSLLTQVASFQIGDGQFIAVPGEVFPFTYLGSFLGPQDMPTPGDPMTPMLMPHLHTPFRFVDGLAEDMLGYIFPEGNAVGIPTTADPQAIQSDDDRFGCNHSDDAESTGPDAGELLGDALVKLLDTHGGPQETEVTGRYLLGDGALSRDPLGGPDSLKCNVDQSFKPDGPAVGVELAGGAIVHPLAWMSLSGLPQARADRDTRGYYNAKGRRVWLNVFPDVTLP